MSIQIKSGTCYGPKIVTEGLVLYLDAINSKSYPGTGTVWYDLSRNHNNCNWNNSATYSSEGYFAFNGTSNYGTITNNPSIDFALEQSLIIWMKHSFITGRRNPWDQAYGGYGTWTHEQGDAINQYFGDAGSNTTPYVGLTSSSTPRDVWNCASITRTTTQHRWYLNGTGNVPYNHSYDELAYTSADIRIGTGYAGYWEGNIAIIMAYNRGLSENEIFQNYNATKERFRN